MSPSFKIVVLPSLLTLAIVATTLMMFMDYLTLRSQRTTYVVTNLRQSRPCAFCHDELFARYTRRLSTLHFRATTP